VSEDRTSLPRVVIDSEVFFNVAVLGPRRFARAFLQAIYPLAYIVVWSAEVSDEAARLRRTTLPALARALAQRLQEARLPHDEIYTGRGKPRATLYVDLDAFEWGRARDYLKVIARLRMIHGFMPLPCERAKKKAKPS